MNLRLTAGAAALVVALIALPPATAGFSDVTDSIANTVGADTLDPPTGLTATGAPDDHAGLGRHPR